MAKIVGFQQNAPASQWRPGSITGTNDPNPPISLEAPAAYVLTAAAGTSTAAGAVATLTAGRVVTAAEGSATAAGQAASLLVGRKITATAGGAVAEGATATLTWSPFVAQSFVLTGLEGSATASGVPAALIYAPAPTGAWRVSGGLWDWLLEVRPRHKKKVDPPKRKKIERIVADAVVEAVADSLDDDLETILRDAERAIAETRQGVEIAKRSLFEQYVRWEVARQRAEVLARKQMALAEKQMAELVAQQAMEQAAARRARRLRRIALFLSVQD